MKVARPLPFRRRSPKRQLRLLPACSPSPRTLPTSPRRSSSKSLGDKLQVLALLNPQALLVLERVADHLLDECDPEELEKYFRRNAALS